MSDLIKENFLKILQSLEMIKKRFETIKTPDDFVLYTSIEWQQIMRFRDIISHHYDSIDNEIVFDICTNHITKLETEIREILN